MRSYRLVILFMVLVIANARVEAQTQREEAVASTVDATLIGRQVANEVIRDYVNEMRSIAVYEACGHKDLAAPLRDKFKPDWRGLAERTHQIKADQIATILLYANDLQLWECRDGEPDEWIQRCRARLARCRSTRQSLLRAGEATKVLAVTRAREKLPWRAAIAQRLAGSQAMEEQRKAAQTFVEIDDARCRSYGDPRSQAYARCIVALPARRSEII